MSILSMICPLCAVKWSPGHLTSPKHQKNKIFHYYITHRKKVYGNSNGVVVSCSYMSPKKVVDDYTDTNIQLSVKPDELVEFMYTIKNNNDTDIIVVGVDLPFSNKNFKINNHQFKFGEEPYEIKPGGCFEEKVHVKFTTPDIGQYEMPIMFVFLVGNERVIIIKEMIVYVETLKNTHVPLPSPYTDLPIYAYNIVKTNLKRQECNSFSIPRACKLIFARELNPDRNWPPSLEYACVDAKNVFCAGVTTRNYARFFHNLLWYEETIVKIHLKKYNMSGVSLEAIPAADGIYRLFVPGLAEKRPSVMQGDLMYIRPHCDDSILFEAIVYGTDQDFTLVHGINAPFAMKYYGPDKVFDIRFFSSRLCYERMHLAVENLMSSDQKCRVFPQIMYSVGTARPITTFFNPLIKGNKEQCIAIENIVSCSSGTAPYIIHGPPGTGKTVTVVETILQILKRYPNSRILVCTDSNTAADHVAELIVSYSQFFPFNSTFLLRANSHYRVWETMPLCLRPYSNGQCFNSFYSVTTDLFSKYSIVVTTLIHSAKFKSSYPTITHLFIDEASLASEPACLIPITALLKVSGQLILSGDPYQMGPVIISNDARRRGLGTSLMERLEDGLSMYSIKEINNNYITLLKNNFRSHPDILGLVNDFFYFGQLNAMAPIDPFSEVDILGQQPKSRALVFHGVCSQEQSDGRSPSYYNDMELEIVYKYIYALLFKHGIRAEDIGVVTPYQRQVYKVKQWLNNHNLGTMLEVGTVEAFQGKEKRVILISTVRANSTLFSYDAMYQLGFLVDDKRFNVAITRAKAKVVIIGNPLCLIMDQKWRALIIKCLNFNTYTGFDINAANSEMEPNALGYLKIIIEQITLMEKKKAKGNEEKIKIKETEEKLNRIA